MIPYHKEWMDFCAANRLVIGGLPMLFTNQQAIYSIIYDLRTIHWE